MFLRTADSVMCATFLVLGCVFAWLAYVSANDSAWMGWAFMSIACVVVGHAFLFVKE